MSAADRAIAIVVLTAIAVVLGAYLLYTPVLNSFLNPDWRHLSTVGNRVEQVEGQPPGSHGVHSPLPTHH